MKTSLFFILWRWFKVRTRMAGRRESVVERPGWMIRILCQWVKAAQKEVTRTNALVVIPVHSWVCDGKAHSDWSGEGCWRAVRLAKSCGDILWRMWEIRQRLGPGVRTFCLVKRVVTLKGWEQSTCPLAVFPYTMKLPERVICSSVLVPFASGMGLGSGSNTCVFQIT